MWMRLSRLSTYFIVSNVKFFSVLSEILIKVKQMLMFIW